MFFNIQEQEERDFTYTTDAEWDREDARERGYARPDQCWILSGRDVWHRNPAYVGPVMPHPEEDFTPEEYAAAVEASAAAYAAAKAKSGARPAVDHRDDDIPF